MRIPLIAGNWKMNKNLKEAIELVNIMLTELDMIKGVEKVICPPFITLAALAELVRGSSVTLGAQNIHFEDKGAFTGEVAASMISDICRYVIVGHSERREYFYETDEVVNKKLAMALRYGLHPILCVGESKEDKLSGETGRVIAQQVELALKSIDIPTDMVIAYEPIWAIGSGQAADGKQAQCSAKIIREIVTSLAGEKKAGTLRILYGGSVTEDNITEFVEQRDIDGALVGGASLDARHFIGIVKSIAA